MCVTTPITALENYYIYSSLEVPSMGIILSHFWAQVAV